MPKFLMLFVNILNNYSNFLPSDVTLWEAGVCGQIGGGAMSDNVTLLNDKLTRPLACPCMSLVRL